MNLFRTSRVVTRLAAFWALFALTVHGVAPFAMASHHLVGAPAETSLEAALKVICTANGTVDRDEQQNQGAIPSTEHCPLCPVHNTTALAPDMPVYGIPFHSESKSVFAAPETGPIDSRTPSKALPRAPPVRLI